MAEKVRLSLPRPRMVPASRVHERPIVWEGEKPKEPVAQPTGYYRGARVRRP